VKTLKDVGTFSILMFLFIFVFALLGMNMFAFKVAFNENDELDLENGTPPDSNFNTFLNAFTTVFIVLTADGWSGIYFQHYRGA
jgi:voltage-dependent calcium channel L type alpha-1D